jgi:hypothetical protein
VELVELDPVRRDRRSGVAESKAPTGLLHLLVPLRWWLELCKAWLGRRCGHSPSSHAREPSM